MNPKIAELYKWSVRRDRRGRWEAKPLASGARQARHFSDRIEALDYANERVREDAGSRVLMALMLAAVQGTKTLG